jgi:hypothetical protein
MNPFNSHVKELIVSDRHLELDALADLLALLEGLKSDLQIGRISRQSWTQCLNQAELRVRWLCLKYQLPEGQLQDHLRAQRQLRAELQPLQS